MNKLRKIGFLVLAFVCAVFAFASCKPKGPTAEQAAARISTTQDKQTITGDFVVNSQVVLEGVTFTVTWTSDNAVAKVGTEKVDKDGKASETGAFYLVTIDYENNTADQTVKLTATVANGKDTATKSISFTVPKFTTLSYAEFAAADDDTSVTVDGIVTGIISKDSKGNSSNALYVNALDSTGGFYVYNLTTDPIADGIREGMTVRVSGLKDTYNGTLEIVSATVKVTDSNVKTVAPVDLTKAFTDAEDTKAEALVGGQALLVTIKGVTIGSINADNGYYNFSLAGKESYVRISSSVCPLTSEQQKTFKEDFASHTGYLANVTGVVCIYNGAFYLTPVAANAVEYLSLPELIDAEQVAYEKEGLDLANTKFAADATIDLPLKGAAYKDVVIAWASDNEQVAINAETGKATITLGSKSATVKLTATLTKGEATDTKEFTLNLSSAAGIEIVDPVDGQEFYFGLYQANNAEYLFFTGVPKPNQVFYQTTTKKVTESVKVKVTAVEGGYTLSFVEGTTTKYITMSINPENGKTSLDIVTDAAKAAVFTYDTEYQTFIQTIGEEKLFMGANGTYDTISASKYKYLSSNFPMHLYAVEDPEEFDKEELPTTILTVTQALAASKGETIIVTGTVKEIQNEEYGNIVITDGTSDILIYGIYDEAGKKYGEWDASLKTLAVGGTVYLVGERSEFNGTQQVKSCKIYVPTGNEGSGEDEPTDEPVTPTYTEMTTAQAVAAEDGTKVKVSGTVVAVNSRGFIVKDAAGLLNVYIASNYDRSLVIGDAVVVEGAVASHNNAKQLVPTKFEKGTNSAVTQPTPTVVTDYAAFVAANKDGATIQYVQVQGTYVVSGNYHNVVFEGTTTEQGSLIYPYADFSALANKEVIVTGYFAYISSSKYIQIMVVSMVEVPAHEHTPAETLSKDETHHWYVCTGCNEPIEKIAHTWNDGVVTTEPTEDAKGVKTFTCTAEGCGQTKTEEIPELSHTHVAETEWSKDETHHWHACSCGSSDAEAIFDKAEHTWGEGVVTTEPTYTAVGVKTYTCTVEGCGQTKTESVDKVPFPTTKYDTITFAEAGELAPTTGDSTEKYYMAGVIKSVYQTTYGNMYLKDEAGTEITVYGTYSYDGSVQYGSMTEKPVAGDYIVVYGVLSRYNGKAQMKNGWIVRCNDNDFVGALNVAADKEELTVAEEVTISFELPLVGTKGSVISWASNNAAIVIDGANATVTQPEIGEDDVEVTLTATIAYGDTTATITFPVVVKAKSSDPNQSAVEAAAADLDFENKTANENFTLPLTVEGHEGVVVSWTSNDTAIAIEGANATVTRPELADGDASVTLTATLTKETGVTTLTFTVKVEYVAEVTVAQFLAAKSNSNVAVLTGYVTAVNKVGSKGSFVLTDEAGTSVFSYDGLNVNLGDKITLKGTYGENSNFAQIVSPVLVETLSTGNDVSTLSGEMVEVDMEELNTLLNTSGTTNANLYETYGSQYLSLEGYAVLSGTYNYLAITNGGNGIVSLYANTSLNVSSFIGKHVQILGFARGGSVSSKYLTIQVQSVVDLTTDAEKLAEAVAAIKTTATVTTTLELEDEGLHGTRISWAVKEGNATITENVAEFEQTAEEQTVVLTATLTLGEETATVDVTVTVKAEGAEAPAEPITISANGHTLSANAAKTGDVTSCFRVTSPTGANLSDYVSINVTKTESNGLGFYANYRLYMTGVMTINAVAGYKITEITFKSAKSNSDTATITITGESETLSLSTTAQDKTFTYAEGVDSVVVENTGTKQFQFQEIYITVIPVNE